MRSPTCRRIGRKTLADDPARSARWHDGGRSRARAPTSSVILYTSGTTGRPKGVMLTFDNVIVSAQQRQPVRQARRRRGSASPICRSPGSATTLLLCAVLRRRLLRELPGEPPRPWSRTGARSAPTYAFAPPRVYENLLTLTMVRMEDAGALKRRMFHYFIGVARALGREDPQRRAGAAARRGCSTALGDVLVYGR